DENDFGTRIFWVFISLVINTIAFYGVLLMADPSATGMIGFCFPLVLALLIQFLGVILIRCARWLDWTRAPWLIALMAVMGIGVFSKESAVAVVGVIVAYDVVYRWTMEDLREAIPSLTVLSVLSVISAVYKLLRGNFGALGLDEGAIPVMRIVLT